VVKNGFAVGSSYRESSFFFVPETFLCLCRNPMASDTKPSWLYFCLQKTLQNGLLTTREMRRLWLSGSVPRAHVAKYIERQCNGNGTCTHIQVSNHLPPPTFFPFHRPKPHPNPDPYRRSCPRKQFDCSLQSRGWVTTCSSPLIQDALCSPGGSSTRACSRQSCCSTSKITPIQCMILIRVQLHEGCMMHGCGRPAQFVRSPKRE
jgi:hypothetical protein